MNKKTWKSIIIMIAIFCSLSFANKVHATVKGEETKYPSVEEIMTDYQVSEEEAVKIRENMIKEDSLYQDNNAVNATTTTIFRQKNQNSDAIKSSTDIVAEQKKEVLEEMMQSSPIMTTFSLTPGKAINMPFYQQLNNYYCGPAATQMALAARGVYVSQYTLASNTWLETDAYGYTIGRYIKYTLNNLLGTDWYVYKEVYEDNTSLLVSRVQLNINNGYIPIVAVYQNGNEIDRILVGHKPDYLRHFIPIYGYNGSTRMLYKDSSSGLGGRFSNVPQDSSISSSTMSYLIWDGSITY